MDDPGGRDPRAALDVSLCDLCRICLDVCPVEAIREPYPPPWREPG
jgi:ferredoxin